jgi:hypothetical protein
LGALLTPFFLFGDQSIEQINRKRIMTLPLKSIFITEIMGWLACADLQASFARTAPG